MSDANYDRLLDEVADIIGAITPAEVEEVHNFLDENDLEAARFYLSYLVKKHKAVEQKKARKIEVTYVES